MQKGLKKTTVATYGARDGRCSRLSARHGDSG
jgi:hypothetical protein